MFYCQDCQKKNKWPASGVVSVGTCESCGNPATCYDVPSRQLPPPHTEGGGVAVLVDTTVESAVLAMRQLTAAQRLEVMAKFCKHCGDDDPKCKCVWDD